MTYLTHYATLDGAPNVGSLRKPAATQVVNFRDVKARWNPTTQQWDDPRYIYIGRANATYKLPASIWANPFKLAKDTPDNRAAVLEQYRAHLAASGLIDRVGELRGKILVCWCAPKACHGDCLLDALRKTAASVLAIAPQASKPNPFGTSNYRSTDATPDQQRAAREYDAAFKAGTHRRAEIDPVYNAPYTPHVHGAIPDIAAARAAYDRHIENMKRIAADRARFARGAGLMAA